MAITATDIKLLESEIMADTTDGGGRRTSRVIPDGVAGNIFPKVSRLDAVYGRVNLRKVYGAVQTASVDTYAGSHAIITDAPDNAKIHTTLFSTGSEFDNRSGARDRIEAYLNKGSLWDGYLLENHISGQKAIQIFQRVGSAAPTIGRTLCLVVNENLSNEVEQYVRVLKTTVETRTFSYSTNNGIVNFDAQVVTCDLTEQLRNDFPGSAPSPLFAAAANKTLLRDTLVADAATYYGIAPLASPMLLNDFKLKATSIYTQLVPSAQSENVLTDIMPSAQVTRTLATTPKEVKVGGAPLSQRIRVGQENRGYNFVTILKPVPAPGTVSVTYRALGNNYRITDDGSGNLTGIGSGTINYTTGSVSVTLQALPDDRSAIVFYWGQNITYTNRSGELNFRLPEYVIPLEHTGITPSSVVITWDSGGVMRTATSNAAGRLVGASATGEVNYNAGLIYIRPINMIDPGGEFNIDYTWSDNEEEAFTVTPDGTGSVTVTLAQEPIPGSIECQWLVNRTAKLSSGSTVSAATTTKNTESGTKSYPPEIVTTTYQKLGGYEPATPQFLNGYNIGGLKPIYVTETLTNEYPVSGTYEQNASNSSSHTTVTSQTSSTTVTTLHTVTDDGAGYLYGTFGFVGYVAKSLTVKTVANFEESSYSTTSEDSNAFESLNATGDASSSYGGVQTPGAGTGGGGSTTHSGGDYGSKSFSEIMSGTMLVRYKTGLVTPLSVTETFTPQALNIDLLPRTKDFLVPGSAQFTWMGQRYYDFEGTLYRVPVGSAATAVACGTVDYAAGVAILTDYVVSGAATSLAIESLWTTKPIPRVANTVFNVSMAPVKSGGLIFSCVDMAGTQLIGTAGLDGLITGDHIRGMMDYQTGLCEIQFGDYLLDSTLTAEDKAEWWYDADNIMLDGTFAGKIWRPWPVFADTLRYNAVAYSYLPLNAAIMGIDPVRLPSDGRVPIYRTGDVAVIHNTGSVTLPDPVVASTTYSVGRTGLSEVWLVDQNGVRVNPNQYIYSLANGTVTMGAELLLTGLVQPLKALHRVEDMVLISDVQITGDVTFSPPVTHAYPASTSYVSSAILFGDMNARVTNLFDLLSFSTWSDSPGTGATSQYNNLDYPVEVLNNGAVTERWRINFTSITAFQVIGENLGVIDTGSTAVDCGPTNQLTGLPYFVLRADGWGSGWSAGNQLRFNTISAAAPIWIARTVVPGATLEGDSFSLQLRGDVDAE